MAQEVSAKGMVVGVNYKREKKTICKGERKEFIVVILSLVSI